jgi:putative tryptophan/tyrosine transport system substrate-binding protein
MRRRDFIKAIAGSTAVWPLAVRAQQTKRVRRIGVFMPYAADDQEEHNRMAAFQQGLQDLGWTDGKNVHIDIRWGGDDRDPICS